MAAQVKTTQQTNSPKEDVKTLALIQLARIGDVLQVAQAAEQLKAQREDLRLVLIARKSFAKPLEFILNTVFDEVFYLDTGTLLDSSGLESSLQNIKDFSEKINRENISALINFTHSKSSGYLASLIQADYKLGPWYDETGTLRVQDPWSQLIYSNVLETSLTPFSLVDLFKNAIGVKKRKSQCPKAIFNPNLKTITIHPFASNARKAWKLSKWSEIIYKVLKDFPDKSVHIVGSKAEVEKAKKLLEQPSLSSFKHRIHNKVGKTTLEDVYNILQKSCLFVGHDSMVGHLAAHAKTPILTISLGTVRPIETAPYMENTYVMAPRTKCFPCKPQDSCDYFQCHADISYQATYAVIRQLLLNGEVDQKAIENENSAFHINATDIYQAQFTEQGVYQLTKLNSAPLNTKDIFRALYRITWSFVLDDKEEKSPFPELSPETHQKLASTLSNLEQLYELCEFGKKYSRFILEEISSDTPQISKVKEFSAKIDEIDNLSKMLSNTNPLLNPIIFFYTLKKGNLKGENIVQLTESSFYAFHECGQVCSILYELIDKTIVEYKQKHGVKEPTQKTAGNA